MRFGDKTLRDLLFSPFYLLIELMIWEFWCTSESMSWFFWAPVCSSEYLAPLRPSVTRQLSAFKLYFLLLLPRSNPPALLWSANGWKKDWGGGGWRRRSNTWQSKIKGEIQLRTEVDGNVGAGGCRTQGKVCEGLRDLFVHRGEGREVSGEMNTLHCGSLDNWMMQSLEFLSWEVNRIVCLSLVNVPLPNKMKVSAFEVNLDED